MSQITSFLEDVQEKRGLPAACIFAIGFPNATTTEQIRSHFQTAGPILDVKRKKDKENNVYCFVQFENPADAQAVVSIVDFHQFNPECALRLEFANINTTFFVGNIENKTLDEISSAFSAFGPLEHVSIKNNETSGFAFVTFKYREDANEAFLWFSQSSNSSFKVQWSRKSRLSILRRNTLFIGGMNLSTTESSLESIFSEYATISRVSVVSSSSNSGLGFGFVEFSFKDEEDSEEILARAIAEKNDFILDGNAIRVQHIQKKAKNPKLAHIQYTDKTHKKERKKNNNKNQNQKTNTINSEIITSDTEFLSVNTGVPFHSDHDSSSFSDNTLSFNFTEEEFGLPDSSFGSSDLFDSQVTNLISTMSTIELSSDDYTFDTSALFI
eukprot:TRINITY_DN3053_c0_g1_i1.p1 TRINITY_DN3053_c0_g1~~TRINITY_DN3053_c0_g1_i1.p1  ORF type:complete len:384 (+),score=93.00 TRINITY_DN3053_c0_g1_i1:1-1152(+)